MKRAKHLTFTVLSAAAIFSFGIASAFAQTATPTPEPKAPEPTFGLEKAPPLPAGMKGSDPKDPRARLRPGLFDAGELAFGMRHLSLLRKPNAFQLGTDDASDPKVQSILGQLGMADTSMIPKPIQLVTAQLAFANSDIAFQGNHLFLGNFYGIKIYDISDPLKTNLLTSIICPGGQGDVSVFRNLLFMSVEMPNGRIDCGTEGFPPPAASADDPMPMPSADKDRFRGVRIFDISDISAPKQVAAVQTCRGSHTHTLLVDPKDKENVYIYVSGTSFVRPSEELAGCSAAPPDEDPNTSLFRIEVIKVPLAAPQDSKVVSTPRVFSDPKTGEINALTDGGSHQNKGRPTETDQCHDITVYAEIGLAAGACAGNGILLDIRDPVNPKRVEAVNDPNYAYWHSASFSNDGKTVVFTDEWGGGMGARCREDDPNVWGANALFRLNNGKLSFTSYYKLPAAQTESENCVAHNGSLIPVPGRDIKVQAWYQGGISLMEFTDPENPVEIGYFDRGPVNANMLILAGPWSSYWYNGYIYSSEIARGLDILELVPTEHLTQNEIDAAKTVRFDVLNVQAQERIVWPRKLVVAKAYVDQLERSGGLPTARISALRQAIQRAESSRLNRRDAAALRRLASGLEGSARTSKNTTDAARLRALADVLKQPEL
jgi:hypothetical protein